MKITYAALLFAASALLLASCGEEEPEQPFAEAPKLVSTTPSDGATGLEGTTLDLVVTMDQNIKVTVANMARVTVTGDATVASVSTYGPDVTVKLEGLGNGCTYTVDIPEGTIQGFKEGQEAAKAVSVTFTMKYVEPERHYSLDPVASLTNSKATSETKNVYKFLLSQSGSKVISGVQSADSNKNDFVDYIHSITGKHPALGGYDFIFLQYSPTPSSWSWKVDYSDISAAREQWEAGGLVSYMWHWNVPRTEDDWKKAQSYSTNNYDFSGYAFYSSSTSFSITEALKEGTWQHEFILSDIKKVASYLKLLQDAGIPVIWRPLHEAAGNYNLWGVQNNAWFWWGKGGAEACKSLYRLLRDQLEGVYGLNNLIWVWTLDATAGAEDEWSSWYPGDEYVDIIGVDIYENGTDAKQRQYQAAVDLARGHKLVTVSECGNIPDPAGCLDAGCAWSWWMNWCNKDGDKLVLWCKNSDGSYSWNNTESYWKRLMSSSAVITRESMPSLK